MILIFTVMHFLYEVLSKQLHFLCIYKYMIMFYKIRLFSKISDIFLQYILLTELLLCFCWSGKMNLSCLDMNFISETYLLTYKFHGSLFCLF